LVSAARPGGDFVDAVDKLVAGKALPAIAFRLGEETQAEFLTRATQAGSPASREGRYEITWDDPRTHVRCRLELRLFSDVRAVEWVLHFTNLGNTTAPVLTDVASLNLDWACDGEAFVYRSPGTDETLRDFQYQCEPLQTIREQQAVLTMNTGEQGRPSVDWLPFFNLQSGDDGLIVALGWSGQWYASINRDGQAARIQAGMGGLRVALEPGESIRGPRVLLLHWRGKPLDGQNSFRRLVRNHYTPHLDGKPVEAPVCYGAWGGSPTPVHLAQIDRIKARQLPYDCYWVDAGWYGTSEKPCPNVFEGDWYKEVGDWRVNRNYHPDTLKPISERVHEAGMDFLLWAEPERARHGAPVTLEHPEWFLQIDPDQPRKEVDNLLLNLGCAPALKWAIETVSGLIEENGVDWYRQDFNFNPLPYWRGADEPDREGITEIRYIEGLYAFWDELRRRHPRLRIDNCAGGGRRLDLELTSRSIPLWRNDYNCFSTLDPEVVQVNGLGLSHWLPQHATSPFNSVPGDTYRFRSIVGPGVVFSLEEFGCEEIDEETYPWDWHRRMLEEIRRARPLWHGDLYPLTTCSTAPDAWLALQLHRPDLGAGMILAFRRAASPITAGEFPLGGIKGDADYSFEDADSGESWTITGQNLTTTGLPLTISRPRTSRLIFYTICRTNGKAQK